MWNISDDHELAKNYAELKKLRFECSCTTKELTAKCTDSRSTTVHDSSNKFKFLTSMEISSAGETSGPCLMQLFTSSPN